MSVLKIGSLFSTALVALIATTPAVAGDGYDHGAAVWEGTCATGLVQSPVDVVTPKATQTSATFRPSYSSSSTASVANIGHTIRVDLPVAVAVSHSVASDTT